MLKKAVKQTLRDIVYLGNQVVNWWRREWEEAIPRLWLIEMILLGVLGVPLLCDWLGVNRNFTGFWAIVFAILVVLSLLWIQVAIALIVSTCIDIIEELKKER